MKKYLDPEKIRIENRKVMVEVIINRILCHEVNLCPQVPTWNNEAKSRLIESLLIRLPLPNFYVDATHDEWVILDGVQRLTALKEFILDESLMLVGMQYIGELEGKFYSDIHRKYQRCLLTTELDFSVILPGTPEYIVHDLFKRIHL